MATQEFICVEVCRLTTEVKNMSRIGSSVVLK